MVSRKQVINGFLEFYRTKNHKVIPNSPLIPENDPTVLFTTAGMHPLVPFLLGQKHPLGKRLCNVQKCIRTVDINSVGDEVHHTFFEMLGKWSLGDYFKKEAIELTFEYITKILNFPKKNLAVTCFKGDENSDKDTESSNTWEKLGIPKERIAFLPAEDNWWGPAGKTGPCGPSTEIFYWSSKSPVPKKFDPNNKKWVEIGNDVLMQYIKDERENFVLAKQKNIDFGGGTERLVTILSGLEDDYLSDCFLPIIKEIEKISGKKYDENKREMRIIADHIKAAVMIISEGIVPGNLEQGYVVRRLIRRAVRYGKNLGIKNFTKKLLDPILKIYDDYENLHKNKSFIANELKKEEEKFEITLENGLKKLQKLIESDSNLCKKDAFLLYQSYGFPIEMIKEEVEKLGKKFPEKECQIELEKHQELSRTATEGRFKSGLADSSEKTTNLHTATHLLLAALRKVLNDKNILQKGSNITAERLRLDFSFDRKLTDKEIKEVEDLVNSVIKKGCSVVREEMSPDQAKKKGALGVFESKYGDLVSVYTIEDFSKEICAGPHAKNLIELGKFKILKEEASSAGVRRIKAVLE